MAGATSGAQMLATEVANRAAVDEHGLVSLGAWRVGRCGRRVVGRGDPSAGSNVAGAVLHQRARRAARIYRRRVHVRPAHERPGRRSSQPGGQRAHQVFLAVCGRPSRISAGARVCRAVDRRTALSVVATRRPRQASKLQVGKPSSVHRAGDRGWPPAPGHDSASDHEASPSTWRCRCLGGLWRARSYSLRRWRVDGEHIAGELFAAVLRRRVDPWVARAQQEVWRPLEDRDRPCNWDQASLFTGLLTPCEQRPGPDSYAAVIIIAEVDGGGFDALDRSRFAPGLTERLN